MDFAAIMYKKIYGIRNMNNDLSIYYCKRRICNLFTRFTLLASCLERTERDREERRERAGAWPDRELEQQRVELEQRNH